MEGACLHQRRPARTVHSCANCYLQPSLSLTLANIPTIISSVWRPGPALRRCRGSWLKFVAHKTVQICVCLLSAVFRPRRGILTAGQRSRFLSFSDASVLTHHLFKGGIVSQSSEITVRSKRMRHERERERGAEIFFFFFKEELGIKSIHHSKKSLQLSVCLSLLCLFYRLRSQTAKNVRSNVRFGCFSWSRGVVSRTFGGLEFCSDKTRHLMKPPCAVGYFD